MLLKGVIVLALVTVLSLHPLGPVRAATNAHVYVLGVSNPTDPLITDLQSLTPSVTILTSVASLLTLSPSSILYIDGSWLATASSLDPLVMPVIVQTVLTGLPTVVVRGDPSILANSVSGLMKYDNPGLPQIAEGVHVTASLAGGLKQGSLLRVIAGFDYSIAAEYQWATQQIPQSISLPVLAPMSSGSRSTNPASITQDPASPYWLSLIQATTDTGTHFKPYGQVITTFSIYQLQNSGSNSSKWFDIFTNQTMIPGAVVFHSSYRNYLETSNAQPGNQNTNIFVSNGPASQISSGPTTVTYTIGTFAGAYNDTVTSTQSMSYFLKNANVTNTNPNPNSTNPNVGWIHTISGGTSAGKLALQFIPGWTDEVAQSYPAEVSGTVVATFATFSDSITTTSTASTGVSFAFSGG